MQLVFFTIGATSIVPRSLKLSNPYATMLGRCPDWNLTASLSSPCKKGKLWCSPLGKSTPSQSASLVGSIESHLCAIYTFRISRSCRIALPKWLPQGLTPLSSRLPSLLLYQVDLMGSSMWGNGGEYFMWYFKCKTTLGHYHLSYISISESIYV